MFAASSYHEMAALLEHPLSVSSIRVSLFVQGYM